MANYCGSWKTKFAVVPVLVSKVDRNGDFPGLGAASYYRWEANGYKLIWLRRYKRRRYVTNGHEYGWVRVPENANTVRW